MLYNLYKEARFGNTRAFDKLITLPEIERMIQIHTRKAKNRLRWISEEEDIVNIAKTELWIALQSKSTPAFERDKEAEILSYLATCVKYSMIDYTKRQTRKSVIPLNKKVPIVNLTSEEDDLHKIKESHLPTSNKKESHCLLQSFIMYSKIPSEHKIILLLHYEYGMTISQIKQIYNVSYPTALKKIKTAAKSIRSWAEREYGENRWRETCYHLLDVEANDGFGERIQQSLGRLFGA
jgi:DNA-directed RNA polymerase specialized sigma24 family protein